MDRNCNYMNKIMNSRNRRHYSMHPENAIFFDYFINLKKKAIAQGYNNLVISFKKIISSITKYPLPIKNSLDAYKLKGVGKRFSNYFEKALSQNNVDKKIKNFKEDFISSKTEFRINIHINKVINSADKFLKDFDQEIYNIKALGELSDDNILKNIKEIENDNLCNINSKNLNQCTLVSSNRLNESYSKGKNLSACTNNMDKITSLNNNKKKKYSDMNDTEKSILTYLYKYGHLYNEQALSKEEIISGVLKYYQKSIIVNYKILRRLSNWEFIQKIESVENRICNTIKSSKIKTKLKVINKIKLTKKGKDFLDNEKDYILDTSLITTENIDQPNDTKEEDSMLKKENLKNSISQYSFNTDNELNEQENNLCSKKESDSLSYLKKNLSYSDTEKCLQLNKNKEEQESCLHVSYLSISKNNELLSHDYLFESENEKYQKYQKDEKFQKDQKDEKYQKDQKDQEQNMQENISLNDIQKSDTVLVQKEQKEEFSQYNQLFKKTNTLSSSSYTNYSISFGFNDDIKKKTDSFNNSKKGKIYKKYKPRIFNKTTKENTEEDKNNIFKKKKKKNVNNDEWVDAKSVSILSDTFEERKKTSGNADGLHLSNSYDLIEKKIKNIKKRMNKNLKERLEKKKLNGNDSGSSSSEKFESSASKEESIFSYDKNKLRTQEDDKSLKLANYIWDQNKVEEKNGNKEETTFLVKEYEKYYNEIDETKKMKDVDIDKSIFNSTLLKNNSKNIMNEVEDPNIFLRNLQNDMNNLREEEFLSLRNESANFNNTNDEKDKVKKNKRKRSSLNNIENNKEDEGDEKKKKKKKKKRAKRRKEISNINNLNKEHKDLNEMDENNETCKIKYGGYEIIMIIDNREVTGSSYEFNEKLKKVFSDKNIKYETRNLPLGDIIWICRRSVYNKSSSSKKKKQIKKMKRKKMMMDEEINIDIKEDIVERNNYSITKENDYFQISDDDNNNNNNNNKMKENMLCANKSIEQSIGIGEDDDVEYEEFVLKWIIERKTLNDLSASIIDGRYDEQKYRMMRLRDIHHIIYLIENCNNTYRNYMNSSKISYETLNNAQHSTQLVSGFSILNSQHMNHTLFLLCEIHEEIIKHIKSFCHIKEEEQHIMRHNDDLSKYLQNYSCSWDEWNNESKKSKNNIVKEIFGKQLRLINMCGPDATELILSLWPTPTKLSAALNKYTHDGILAEKMKRIYLKNHDMIGKKRIKSPIDVQLIAQLRQLYAPDSIERW
ncbi:crossover junction endonuclease MUS81, putative [Plasmodium gaboni]|uniref:Crossover junction endonuclease MUS81 n=1 Tax=Plasmodium gaboni TaxID=647221 RepID=A0ABY1UUB2_9APIC|nr:crossover junction endonuclease MUS81, putative [Plasmodium gaboni]